MIYSFVFYFIIEIKEGYIISEAYTAPKYYKMNLTLFTFIYPMILFIHTLFDLAVILKKRIQASTSDWERIHLLKTRTIQEVKNYFRWFLMYLRHPIDFIKDDLTKEITFNLIEEAKEYGHALTLIKREDVQHFYEG